MTIALACRTSEAPCKPQHALDGRCWPQWRAMRAAPPSDATPTACPWRCARLCNLSVESPMQCTVCCQNYRNLSCAGFVMQHWDIPPCCRLTSGSGSTRSAGFPPRTRGRRARQPSGSCSLGALSTGRCARCSTPTSHLTRRRAVANKTARSRLLLSVARSTWQVASQVCTLHPALSTSATH